MGSIPSSSASSSPLRWPSTSSQPWPSSGISVLEQQSECGKPFLTEGKRYLRDKYWVHLDWFNLARLFKCISYHCISFSVHSLLPFICLQPIPYQMMEHDRVTNTHDYPISIRLISGAPPLLHLIAMVTTSKPKVLGSCRINSESLSSCRRYGSTNRTRFMPAAEWTH